MHCLGREFSLLYCATSGTRLTKELIIRVETGLKDAVDRMKPPFIDKCRFVNPPNIKEKIQWVWPKLVCEVAYAELTADDQLRQTTFLGWRDDKKTNEVVLEQPR